MLTPRERMVRALSVEQPDRIPTFETWIAPPTADLALGRRSVLCSLSRQYALHEAGRLDSFVRSAVDDTLELVRKLGWSAIAVRSLPTEPRPVRIDERRWRVGDEEVYIQPRTGFHTSLRTEVGTGGIKALRDHVSRLEEEDIEVDEGCLALLHSIVKRLKREKMDVFIFFLNTAPFPHKADWIPTILKSMHTEPGLAARYFERDTKRAIALGEAAIDTGCDGILGGCDLAYRHGPMMSPKHYREFILPHMVKQSDAYHKKGAFMINRSDGNLWPIIDDFLINSKVDGMHEIEPTAGMDLALLKERFGDRRCLMGNVDCGQTLCFGTREEVAQETLECIGKAAKGGGYVLTTSNSVHGGVRPENYLTMLETWSKNCEYDTLKSLWS